MKALFTIALLALSGVVSAQQAVPGAITNMDGTPSSLTITEDTTRYDYDIAQMRDDQAIARYASKMESLYQRYVPNYTYNRQNGLTGSEARLLLQKLRDHESQMAQIEQDHQDQYRKDNGIFSKRFFIQALNDAVQHANFRQEVRFEVQRIYREVEREQRHGKR